MWFISGLFPTTTTNIIILFLSFTRSYLPSHFTQSTRDFLTRKLLRYKVSQNVTSIYFGPPTHINFVYASDWIIISMANNNEREFIMS